MLKKKKKDPYNEQLQRPLEHIYREQLNVTGSTSSTFEGASLGTKRQYGSAKAFSHAASLTDVTILLLSQQGLIMLLLLRQPLTILINTL